MNQKGHILQKKGRGWGVKGGGRSHPTISKEYGIYTGCVTSYRMTYDLGSQNIRKGQENFKTL